MVLMMSEFRNLQHDECPKCLSLNYGHQTVFDNEELDADSYKVWMCRNCNFQPHTNIRGLI